VPASKNDVEMFKISAASQKTQALIRLGLTAVRMVTVGFCVYCTANALKDFAKGGPEVMGAFALVIHRLRLDSIAGYVFGAGGVTYGLLERGGKRRAIGKAGRLQKQLEAGEPNRTSSDLTEYGDVPDDE